MSYKQLLAIVFFLAASHLSFAQNTVDADSITLIANPNFDKAGRFKRFVLGTNYRKVWAQPIKMPVFHLDKEKGGLRITGTGGGNQTSSLQMVDSSGREWVLRSVNKSISRDQPKIYKNTLVEDIMVDAGSIGHPYSALAVPPMAEALGIQHSNPKVVYLGDDPALGKYREEFANKMYLFEERGPADGSKDINTEKLQARMEKDNSQKANAKLILRARIFDMIMGDWDRHGGQWKWTRNKDSSKNTFEPYPRDRDKVFYTTGGAIFWAMSLAKPNLQAYTDHIRRVDLWNYNTVAFDLYFLNELNQKDWDDEIAYVQSVLTDGLMERSLRLMPANVYAVSAPAILKIFKRRRDRIKKYAINYYHFLATRVDIAGSDKNEKFTIAEKDNGDVAVTINKIKKDSIGKEIYHRTFKKKQTKELRIYGLEGKNNFEVTGNTPSPIKVRLIGGHDTDTYVVDSTLQNRKDLYIYDRKDQENNLPSKSAAHLVLKKDTAINKYIRPENKYNTITPIVALGYSTEDGLQLVAGANYVRYSFQKHPYSSHQHLSINYTFQKKSFIVNYSGVFKNKIGHNDLLINITERGPRNTNNFFGLGNVGEFDRSSGKEFYYYRNRYDYAVADVRIAHQYNHWQLSGGSVTQFYTASENHNQDHFFKQYDQLHPDANVFKAKLYTGAIAGAVLDTRNNSTFANHGVVWRTTLTGLIGVNVADHATGAILSTFSFFLPLKDSTIVLANRTGAGTIVGKGEFFQMMNLGGLTMRGYHTSRFIGNTMLYNNLELRAKLFQFNAYVFPSAFGLVGFNDTGRVWLKGESSDTVHNTYGGGIFLTPYNAFLLEVVGGKSPEGTLAYISFGFRF
nr:hypothetical protein [uncultured Mucilaginibacter sp.]